MSMFDAGRPEDHPPSWFQNEEESDVGVGRASLRRWLIGLGAVAIVAIFILIPVLQAEILQRRREALPDAATERTAVLFASAMLFGRSEGQAMLFSDARARDDVRATIRRFLDHPQPSNDARLQVVAAPCRGQSADYCFQGRIIDPGSDALAVIRFGLDATDDGPRIVWVEVDGIMAANPMHARMKLTISRAMTVTASR